MSAAPPLLVVALAGSRAHGTAVPGSDVDLRGVAVLPLARRLSLWGAPTAWEGELGGPVGDRVAADVRTRFPDAPKVEAITWELARFLTLAAGANPTALELLFADEVLFGTAAWSRLAGQRERFLSRRVVQAYTGYAARQLREVEVSRRPKDAAHLLRLLRTADELLRERALRVRRPDAAELVAVRTGTRPLDDALAEARQRLDALATTPTDLPAEADRAAIDALYLELLGVG